MIIEREHIGKKVVCIDSLNTPLIKGDVYTIRDFRDNDLIKDCYVELEERTDSWSILRFILLSDYLPELRYDCLSNEKKLFLCKLSLDRIPLEYFSESQGHWIERANDCSTYFCNGVIYRVKDGGCSRSAIEKLEAEFQETCDRGSELFCMLQEIKKREISQIN